MSKHILQLITIVSSDSNKSKTALASLQKAVHCTLCLLFPCICICICMLSVLSLFPYSLPLFSLPIYTPQFSYQPNSHTPKMTSLEAQSTTAALEKRAAARLGASLPPPTATEPLPCPRCQSPDTKFCYYNNYNFSQPRYFCKSCRRYWTRGGALRDVPVGGGTRKSAKRSRTASPASSSTSAAVTVPVPIAPMNSMPIYSSGEIGGEASGKFTTLLAFGGLGFGLGLGLEEDRCGSRYVGSGHHWIMQDSAGYPINVNGTYGGDGVCGHGGATWQMDGGEYYSSLPPELAISTPTNDDDHQK